MSQVTYYPSRDEYLSLAVKGGRIPVCREILADLETPVTAYMKVATERSFLLESAERGEAWSRYSFIGLEPAETFRFRDGRVEHTVGGAYRVSASADPLAALHQLVHESPARGGGHLPRFWGGAVGYVAYDLIRSYERLPSLRPDELHLPDGLFLVVDTVVVFDHLLGRMLLVSAPPVGEDARASYDEAVRNINLVYSRLRAPLPRPPAPGGGPGSSAFKSNFAPQGFHSAVERAKDYIARGDIFQVVLSLRLSAPLVSDPFNLYRALRSINPSPYMGFLRLGEVTLVASSPESLVKCADEYIETRPIAGTRRRGASREEDERLQAELLGDEKERAEHVMLVDLGRNDLGRVAEFGSVNVEDLMAVERYSHVMHLVSRVRGKLRRDKTPLDALASCLPMGTVSGAPKIRAMEIIEELEPVRRGPYGGAFGYVSFSGNMDMALTLRTFVIARGKVYIQAGAGIVADSVAEREYEECLNKAKALLKAVDLAEGGL